MSKKFRSLVGAMLSASICSSCVSSGLSKGVKWAVGVPVAGAFAYLGGRKLGLWGADRRRRVQLNYYIDGKDGDGNLLGDNNDDDDAQPSDEDGLSDEERVAKRAGEIKKLVGEDNYNVLGKFYELEKENLENSNSPFGSKLASEGLVNKLSVTTDCSSYYFEYDGSSGKSLDAKGIFLFGAWLGEVFRAVFVSGNCEVSRCLGSSANEFYVRVPQLHLCQVVFRFLPSGKVEIVVNSRIYGCLKVSLVSPKS